MPKRRDFFFEISFFHIYVEKFMFVKSTVLTLEAADCCSKKSGTLDSGRCIYKDRIMMKAAGEKNLESSRYSKHLLYMKNVKSTKSLVV